MGLLSGLLGTILSNNGPKTIADECAEDNQRVMDRLTGIAKQGVVTDIHIVSGENDTDASDT